MSNCSATLWTTAHQDPLSMGFSRQEYWSGLPLPSPGDLPDPGIETTSPDWQADSLPLSYLGSLSCRVSLNLNLVFSHDLDYKLCQKSQK